MNNTAFKDKKILIVGGSGFIGKNLMDNLKGANAKITVLDINNRNNMQKDVDFVQGDVRKINDIKKVIVNKDIIVDLAALRPIESVSQPVLDLEITCKGALNILESCRLLNPKSKIIFFGSSLEFGEVAKIPVSEENNLPKPDSFYGIHKGNLSHYSRLYWKLHKINSTVLRFSNIYGPEYEMSEKMSIVNLFINLARNGKDIIIYGDGKQERDYIYVGDALSALEKSIVNKRSCGETFNIGLGKPTSLIDMAKTVIKVVGEGKIKNIPWPKDYRIEPRDYYTDYKKAKKLLGWTPRYDLDRGVRITLKRLNLYDNISKTK